MENNNPKRRDFSTADDRFNREDATGRDGAYKAYSRDKRTRTTRSEQALYSTSERGDRYSHAPNRERSGQRDFNREDGDRPRRKSFNPNFNRDNTPNFTPRPRRQFGEGKPYGERQQFGERKSYGERQYGEQGERRSYGENRGYGERQYGERKPYNNNRPYGERKQYGERKPYGERRVAEEGGRFERRQPQYNKPRYDAENYPTYPAPVIEDTVRLNRYIAMSGICSRREADDYITSGVVTVNDEVVTELGSKVSQNDVVKLNGKVLVSEKMVYIVMNKPKGYVTSVEDPHADKTVMDLVKGCCKERVYPVGRLDKNSMGVLLITNDGELTKQIAHPAYEKKKVYQVTLDKPMDRADMERLVDGVELEDGFIRADAIEYAADKKNEIGIEIHSGRNRIVRRMFEKVGYHVAKLDRVYFAGLTKQRLKRGAWRFLTPREVSMLKSGSYE
ncbi:MAG: pseudouridine synthase [Tidjanibacter sp.]|nr:pseudouridine synthase [Tidjanibacter sp.]